ncbi:hypothetical protein DFH09DRAFT_1089459 [Mycena vulgaris]|nr:hypothetical protein DFH09DRAFT_1089459 [Mycena vulgaris]
MNWTHQIYHRIPPLSPTGLDMDVEQEQRLRGKVHPLQRIISLLARAAGSRAQLWRAPRAGNRALARGSQSGQRGPIVDSILNSILVRIDEQNRMKIHPTLTDPIRHSILHRVSEELKASVKFVDRVRFRATANSGGRISGWRRGSHLKSGSWDYCTSWRIKGKKTQRLGVGNRTPGGSKVTYDTIDGNDPGYHYPTHATIVVAIFPPGATENEPEIKPVHPLREIFKLVSESCCHNSFLERSMAELNHIKKRAKSIMMLSRYNLGGNQMEIWESEGSKRETLCRGYSVPPVNGTGNRHPTLHRTASLRVRHPADIWARFLVGDIKPFTLSVVENLRLPVIEKGFSELATTFSPGKTATVSDDIPSNFPRSLTNSSNTSARFVIVDDTILQKAGRVRSSEEGMGCKVKE